MQSPTQPDNSSLTLRNASDPYILLFDESQYSLSLEALEYHADAADLKRKRFHWPDIKFVSLKDGMLELIATGDNKSFNLVIQVEKDMLQIACDCASSVHKLCVHAYQTIYKLVLCKGDNYFGQFCRGGIIELALSSAKYFDVQNTGEGITVTPKAGIGKPFSTSEQAVSGLTNFLSLSIPPAVAYNAQAGINTVTGYAVVYSRKSYHLPLILPFVGKPDKEGTTIKSFLDFIRIEKDITSLQFTDEQRLLNGICIEMYRVIQEQPSTILSNPDALPAFITLFHLWQKALPLVLKEQFVYRYHSFRLKFLKTKPHKQYMRSCVLHTETPKLSFTLSEKEDFYVLKLSLTIKGKAVRRDDYENAFLLLKEKSLDEFYLLPSITDVALLEYFADATNTITIFKQYYKAFRDGFLKALSERYPLRCLTGFKKESAEIKIYNLKPVRKILRMQHQQQGGILFFLFVEYDDGTKINSLLDGIGWLAERNKEEVCMQRDKKYEAAFTEYVQALHPDFSSQLPADCFYLSLAAYIKNNWLNEVQAKLTDFKVEYNTV